MFEGSGLCELGKQVDLTRVCGEGIGCGSVIAVILEYRLVAVLKEMVWVRNKAMH